MPIYEYQCDQCGRVEEIFQKISEKPLTKCGHCSGKLHKLISQSAFHLKGTGWYVTDYAGKQQSKKQESDSGTPPASATSSESSKTETKKSSSDD
ncbi:MAG: zinc ribbon domain-containing protein [Desulfatitalea sp.]|nr:zinc ribbon domain-containing protein [Desulfatitalea sp.]